MNIQDKIALYVDTSRRVKHDFLNLQYYQQLYKSLCESESDKNLPELFVTYSANRNTELVCIDGSHYIIYDQYLGQTMAMLNRIFYFANNPMPTIMYACKYLAESLRLKGYSFHAHVFAQSYAILREKIDLPKDLAHERHILTILQELFVLAHEVGHYLYRYNNELMSYFIKVAKVIFDDEVKQEASSIHLLLLDKYNISLDQRQSSGAIMFDDYEVELVCDLYACFQLMNIKSDELKVSLDVIYKATLMAFKHLRSLKLLDNFSLNLIAGKSQISFEGDIIVTQIREHLLRKGIKAIITSLSHADTWAEISHTIPDVMEHYDFIIEAPIIIDLPKRAMKFGSKKDHIRGNFKIGDDDRLEIEIVKSIDEITGWT